MRPRILAALAGLAAMFALLGGSTAASGAQTSLFPDLSTAAAIDSYLVSKGIDPATVVKQRGLKNYAGPACPGAGWKCTASTRVVQVAPTGGQNVADCVAGGSCVVLQIVAAGPSSSSPNNMTHCKKRDTGDDEAQHCDDIDQLGPRNHAIVDEQITSKGGPEQDAIQTAHVKQQGVFNNSDIHQDVKQSTKAPGNQEQDVHQVALVEQVASGDGENFSHVHQTQDQNASGAVSSQMQNTELSPVTDCVANVFPDDPSNPNACANVNQSSATGNNKSHLHQLVNEQAKSTMLATQQQGIVVVPNSKADGGNDGDVEQATVAPGSNENHVVQQKRQRLETPAGTQKQYDPSRCCVGTQFGGANNSEDINQDSEQSASLAGADQLLTLIGGSVTPGKCDITHHARQNKSSMHFTASEPGPCAVAIETKCTDESGCPAEPTVLCIPTVEECCVVECDGPILLALPSTATLGLPIPMLDLTAEPSSFVPPIGFPR